MHLSSFNRYRSELKIFDGFSIELNSICLYEVETDIKTGNSRAKFKNNQGKDFSFALTREQTEKILDNNPMRLVSITGGSTTNRKKHYSFNTK